MIVQEKKKAIKKPVLRFKMYKSGKQMINASFIGLSMVGVMTVTSTINANADANTNPPATVSQTSQASTTATPGSGSNTVTNQVTVNSSTLDNAVSAAKSAGLPVNTKPATSQTVQESQVPVARQQIESDYQSQAAKINSTVAEYNHAKSNYSTYNGAKGDNSALNAAVSNASTIPGLSVVKDSDHPTTSVSASSDDAIVSASAAIQSDYANQIKQISDAIATLLIMLVMFLPRCYVMVKTFQLIGLLRIKTVTSLLRQRILVKSLLVLILCNQLGRLIPISQAVQF